MSDQYFLSCSAEPRDPPGSAEMIPCRMKLYLIIIAGRALVVGFRRLLQPLVLCRLSHRWLCSTQPVPPLELKDLKQPVSLL